MAQTTKTKQSYAERIREKQRAKAEEKLQNSSRNEKEWLPEIGTHRVRFLPPIEFQCNAYNSAGELIGQKGEEDELFYVTHAYHFFEGIGPDGQGRLLWTPKNFKIDGKIVKDPVDEVVAQMYDIARTNKDGKLKAIAGSIKRKRQFFAHVLKEDDNGDMVYNVLKDASNDGKLIKEVCKHMGFPFYRDVHDEWVVKESLEIDEEQTIYDLIDIDLGHDFKIKKVKTGHENWDISYDSSFVVKNPRPLTDEERELLDERVDLRNYVTYVTYEELKEAFEEYLVYIGLNDEFEISERKNTKKVSKKEYLEAEDTDEEFFDEMDEDEEEEVEQPKNTKTKKATKKVEVKEEDEEDEEDEDFDEDLLDELEDDEEEK